MKKRALRTAVLLFSLVASAGTSAQPAYPIKPIRLVVPYTPARATIRSRARPRRRWRPLGQSIIVDNRPARWNDWRGAGRSLRTRRLHLAQRQASFATNVAIRAKMPYDVYKDFAYIGMMTKSPMIIVVHPSMPVKSLKELIALARKRPGDLNYGSSGTGGSNHLATELFAKMAQIKIVHVPYKSIGPAITDLLGGNVQMVITSLPSALVQVKAGRLKALGVASAERSRFAPDIPTVKESGVPYVSELWWGLAAPARTPPEIINRLSDTLRKAMQTPQLKEQYCARRRRTRSHDAAGIHEIRLCRSRSVAPGRQGRETHARMTLPRRSFEPQARAPLEGVRVLDLSRVVAGNMLSLMLADFGAEVIKVEPPEGDALRDWLVAGIAANWKVYARNKKSVCLDLRKTEARELLLKLVDTAQVLVENFRPGTLEKMGLGPDVLHERNAKLIIVRVTGWGQTGPYKHKPGFGTLAEGMSGFAASERFRRSRAGAAADATRRLHGRRMRRFRDTGSVARSRNPRWKRAGDRCIAAGASLCIHGAAGRRPTARAESFAAAPAAGRRPPRRETSTGPRMECGCACRLPRRR
jgi:tripartite-type tricarboxylate transporter receptor subunit TctC